MDESAWCWCAQKRCYKSVSPKKIRTLPRRSATSACAIGSKARLKEDGHWGKVRAIGTTCMDVCARRRVTVVIAPQTDEKATEAFVIDPVADREALYSTYGQPPCDRRRAPAIRALQEDDKERKGAQT